MGEHIFSRTGPHNRTHEFQSTQRPTAPKFLVPKEDPNIQLELPTMAKAVEEISTQNGPFNFYSNSMSSCVSQ